MDAVAIAGGQHANKRRALRNKRRVVADSRTCRHTAQMDDFAPQAHHRLERQEPLRFLAPVHGIVARMVAIQNRPGPHHVRPGLWTRDDGGAIGEMDQARIDAQAAQWVERRVEALLLFPRLLAGGGVGENFRRREVGKDARELEVPAFADLPRKTVDIGKRDSQAVHAAVDFQMKASGFATAACRRAFEQRQLVAPMDRGGEVVLEQARFLARDETGQHQNGLAYASLAHGDAFVGAGHTKPVRSGFLKGLGDLWAAMAVTIALDDGQDLAPRLALLSRRIHVLANSREVVRERTERNFRPDGSSCFVAGTFLFAWHRAFNLAAGSPRCRKCQFTTTASSGKTATWAAARKRQQAIQAMTARLPAPVLRKHLQGLRLVTLGPASMPRSAPKPRMLIDLATRAGDSKRVFDERQFPTAWLGVHAV